MEEMGMTGAVFVQTNEAENRVIAFRRGGDGALERTGDVATGGSGDGVPHLTSQGSVTLTGDGRHLLATNAGSDDLSVFSVQEDATVSPLSRVPVGSAPKSVAEHDGLVYALATGKPALAGFRLGMDGLEPLVGSERPLSAANADPAQVDFTREGRTLIVTERGTDSISAYSVASDGMLGEPKAIPSSGPTPYGFAITGSGTLVVTEAFRAERGAAAASAYRIMGDAVTPITASIGNGRSEICWAVITPDDRFAFTTNFADGAVSRYGIAMDGSLMLEDATAGISTDGQPGLRDEDLTGDGRFLYAIDADAGRIHGWAVDQNGSLRAIGSWGELPATVAGLAAS
jgi:6-phosphogluconolactonase (cycloisomerase 2 family)